MESCKRWTQEDITALRDRLRVLLKARTIRPEEIAAGIGCSYAAVRGWVSKKADVVISSGNCDRLERFLNS